MKSLTVPARIDQLDAVLEFIDLALGADRCPPKARRQLAVAAEEVFVNIARYAYDPGEGEVTIEIDVANEPPVAVLRFLDRGLPYNPLKKMDPDVTLATEAREIGGLGIFMVKKMADCVDYAHESNRNVLTLKKTLA